MPQGSIIPDNSILVAGQPIILEKEARTITNLAPGRLVIFDTTDYQCTYAGAAAPDVIGVADCPSDKRVSDYTFTAKTGVLTTTFTAGDQIRVLSGPVDVKLMAVSGATIAVGTRLVSAAAGMVSNGATAGQCVGYSLDAPTLTTACKWIRVHLLI